MTNSWKVCSICHEGDATTWHSAVVGTGAVGMPPYRLLYELGRTTHAAEGTLGIMCLAKQEYAEEFAKGLAGEFVVLLCTTEHKPEELRRVLFWRDADVWNKLRGSHQEVALRGGSITTWSTGYAPLGTVTVPSLTVVGPA